MGAKITLDAGGANGGVGTTSPVTTIDLTGGLSALSAANLQLLSSASASDVIGVYHPLYKYIGPANNSLDLETADFTNGALWTAITPTFTSTQGAVTLNNGNIVLAEVAHQYGMYTYIGTSNSLVNLTQTNYANPLLWAPIIPTLFSSATSQPASVGANSGLIVEDDQDFHAKSITLQLAHNVRIEATSTINASSTGGVGLTSDMTMDLGVVQSGGVVNLQTNGVGASIIDTGATGGAISANGGLVLNSLSNIENSTGGALRMTITNGGLDAEGNGTVDVAEQSGNLDALRAVSDTGMVTVSDAAGNITAGSIAGATGATVDASGSILNAYDDALAPFPNVSSTNGNVTLTAGTAAGDTIGLSTDPLDVDIPLGLLDATAGGSMYLHASGIHNLSLGTLTSSSGDISIHADQSIFDAYAVGVTTTNIDARNVNLTATNGTIGSGTEPLFIESSYSATGSLYAVAHGSVYITQNGKGAAALNLNLGYVQSQTGDVTLTAADGSITNADIVADPIQVIGDNLNFAAPNGSIGHANVLVIDSQNPAPGKINATALDDIYLAEASGAMAVGTIQSNAGNIQLSVREQATHTGADFGMDAVATVAALGGSIVILAGNDISTAAGSKLSATNDITIESDIDDVNGQDTVTTAGTTITIDGSLRSAHNIIAGGINADTLTLHPTDITGWTQMFGNLPGNLNDDRPNASGVLVGDTLTVDQLPTMAVNGVISQHVRTPGGPLVTDSIDLDGEGSNDNYIVNTTGNAVGYLVNVHDSGAPGLGPNNLTINGTTMADTFLVRANFVALLTPDPNAATDGTPYLPGFERINYDTTITGRLQINGVRGDDHFFLDDNSAITTIDGGTGNDTFQIGQLFGEDRVSVANANGPATVAAGDEIDTLLTTDGYLSRGISYATTIYGGNGADTFVVYSNGAVLKLYGAAGDDQFVVRAFILSSGNVSTDETDIYGGTGNANIQYNINAPVNIQGGTGVNSVVILGTDAPDNFVVTANGVSGAGLNTSFVGIQKLEIDGLGGNDNFYVLSSNPDMVTTLIGGTGSDTFNVGGDVTSKIVALNANGTSAYINHGVTSDDPAFAGIFANGISMAIAGTASNPVAISQPTGQTTVIKGSTTGADVTSYSVQMVEPAPTVNTALVYMSISAALIPSYQGGNGIEISTDDVHWSQSVVMTYDPTATSGPNSWTGSRTIYVKAINDTAEAPNQIIEISSSLQSTNPAFNKIVLPNVDVKVIDANRPQLLLGNAPNGINVYAGGSDGTYNVVLSRAPVIGETVTVSLATNPALLTLSSLSSQFAQQAPGQDTITFTSANWNVPVSVSAHGIEAASPQNPVAATITMTETSSGGVSPVYASGTTAQTIPVTIVDTRLGGLIVTPQVPGAILTPLDPYFYTLALTKAPLPGDTVVVSLLGSGGMVESSEFNDPRFTAASGSNPATLTPATVTFDSSNWNQPFYVEVTVAAGAPANVPSQPVQVFQAQPHVLSAIQGPLIIEGDVMPGRDRSLVEGVILPTETDVPLQPEVLSAVAAADAPDTLNIFDDGAVSGQIGSLGVPTNMSGLTSDYGAPIVPLVASDFGFISGLGLAGDDPAINQAASNLTFGGDLYLGGISYHDVGVVNVMMGSGDDHFTVSSTTPGTITVIQGGGGNNTLIATGGGGANSPLVLFGATSQDGSFYNSTTGSLTAYMADPVNNPLPIAREFSRSGQQHDRRKHGSEQRGHLRRAGRRHHQGQPGRRHHRRRRRLQHHHGRCGQQHHLRQFGHQYRPVVAARCGDLEYHHRGQCTGRDRRAGHPRYPDRRCQFHYRPQ